MLEMLHSIIIIGCHSRSACAALHLLSCFPPFNYRLFVRLHAPRVSRRTEFHYVLLRIDRWDWFRATKRANFSLVAQRNSREFLTEMHAIIRSAARIPWHTGYTYWITYIHTCFSIGAIHLRSPIIIITHKYRHCRTYYSRRISLLPLERFFVLTFLSFASPICNVMYNSFTLCIFIFDKYT